MQAGHAEFALASSRTTLGTRNNLGLALASPARIEEALGQYRKAL